MERSMDATWALEHRVNAAPLKYAIWDNHIGRIDLNTTLVAKSEEWEMLESP